MPELKDFASSVAMVVSSCDAFFDAWRPFAFFFRKHWSDCPFPVFLIVNRLRVRSKLPPADHGGTGPGLGGKYGGRAEAGHAALCLIPAGRLLPEWSGEPGAVGRGFLVRLRPRRRFFLLLRPITTRARFRAVKRSLRDCPQRIRRTHPAPGDAVEKGGPPIRAAAGRIGLEHGGARERKNTRPPYPLLHGTRQRPDSRT